MPACTRHTCHAPTRPALLCAPRAGHPCRARNTRPSTPRGPQTVYSQTLLGRCGPRPGPGEEPLCGLVAVPQRHTRAGPRRAGRGTLTHPCSCSPRGPRCAWAPGGWGRAAGAAGRGALAPASSFSAAPSGTPETPVKHEEGASERVALSGSGCTWVPRAGAWGAGCPEEGCQMASPFLGSLGGQCRQWGEGLLCRPGEALR